MERDNKGRFQKPENNRVTHSADNRDANMSRKPWAPPSMLETPPAPPGYVYRWIRAEVLNSDDKKNVMARTREGFELVRSEEIGDFELPSIQDGKHAGVVAVGGLLLAKIPEETRNERNAYYENRTLSAQEAVDNDLMKESDARSPIMSPRRTSSVTFGGGKRK
tara:strand:+ start:5383 stop:5874 length:492 start_codon:yes stop_codon:yes gene_type:complete